MSFSFGFFEEGNNKDGVNCSSTAILQSDGTTPSIPLKRHPPLAMFDGGGDIVYTPVVYGGFNFGKVDVEGKEEAVDKESDIIPGVYEGGNKVWECSVDLTVLLMSQKCSLPSPGASRAIELGCGHGFPGIAALKLGYQQVVFSDLNGEVIESATWPNIYLNCREQMARAVCYSGDWSALSTELTNSGSYGDGMFELILSAETLYTEACCKKVFEMVLKHLAPGGCALIASKRFYFGVGGGTYSLQSLVEADGRLAYELVQVYEDGQSNIREIIVLRYR